MKHYSFIKESKNHFLKVLSRYNPEKQKKIVEKLRKLGKSNGGLYDSEEYARRMMLGQRKRLSKIANKNKRQYTVLDTEKALDGRMTPSTNVVMYSKPKPEWDGTIDKNNYTTYRNSIRGKDTLMLPKKTDLVSADALTHEIDEYDLLFKISNNLKLTPQEVNYLTWLHNIKSSGSHNLGVLKRENKRRKLLSSLYDVKFHQRNPEEYITNKVSYKTLLSYIGSIKEKERKLLQNDVTKKGTLEILKRQKSIIEDFIRRKEIIQKMPNGLKKDAKLLKLKQDIEKYNSNLDANRKMLKIDN